MSFFPPDLAKEMGSTEAATTIAGPSVGAVTQCHLTHKFDGAPAWNIDVDVLCLGETHSQLRHIDWSNNATVVDVVRLAGWRAAHQLACVDLFLEFPVDRGFADRWGNIEIDYSLRLPYSIKGQSLTQLNKTMFPNIPAPRGADVRGWADAVVDPRHVRVHACDARADSSLHFGHEGMRHAADILYMKVSNDPTVSHKDALKIMWYLMGFDGNFEIGPAPPPPALTAALEQALGAVHAATWVEAHVRVMTKVHSRARRIHAAHARLLGHAVIRTQPLRRLTDLTAGATDFYLMLRMLVPYDGWCGRPRHCIVYAGGFHTDHVTNILLWLQGRDAYAEPSWSGLGKVLQVSKIRPWSAAFSNVGGVLYALGLKPVADAVPQHVFTPFNLPRKRARLDQPPLQPGSPPPVEPMNGLQPGSPPPVEPMNGLQPGSPPPVEPINGLQPVFPTQVDAADVDATDAETAGRPKRPRDADNDGADAGDNQPSTAERTVELWSLMERHDWHMSDFYGARGLLAAGASTLRPGALVDDPMSEDTAVNVAIDNDHPELVRYIIRAPGGSGLDASDESFYNERALVRAALRGMLDVVVALTEDQQTGRAGAAERGCRYTIDELDQKLGGDFVVPAIVAAAYYNHEDVALYLKDTASALDINLASAVAWLREFDQLADDLGDSDMPTGWPELADWMRADGFNGIVL
jgi:hypothetical protein